MEEKGKNGLCWRYLQAYRNGVREGFRKLIELLWDELLAYGYVIVGGRRDESEDRVRDAATHALTKLEAKARQEPCGVRSGGHAVGYCKATVRGQLKNYRPDRLVLLERPEIEVRAREDRNAVRAELVELLAPVPRG